MPGTRPDSASRTNFQPMPGHTGIRDHKTTVFAQANEPHALQALKAGLITQTCRPPCIAAKQKSVQGRAATCF